MKDFIRTTQTIKDFMEARGFTLFTDNKFKICVWIAKFADAEDDVTGHDKFIVVEDDLTCCDIWEFEPEARKDFTDDELAQMIADVGTVDVPTWCVTAEPVEKILFA